MSQQTPLYRAAKSASLVQKPLDEMTLIFHRASGITHMVVEPIPQILDIMGAQEMTAANVADKLSAEYDLGEPDDVTPVITERLDEMAMLGLIEKLPARAQGQERASPNA